MSERARFKRAIPLVTVTPCEIVKGEPFATAYYRGDVLKYAGDVLSPEQVAQENVRTVKVQQYMRNHTAREGGGVIAEGVVEPLTPAQREVLNEKIKRMTDMPNRFQEKHAGKEVG